MLTEKESSVISVGDEQVQGATSDGNLCLVGKVMAGRLFAADLFLK